MKKVKEIILKNIKKEKGGTKKFTIFLNDDLDGSWKEVLTDEFNEQKSDGCTETHTIDLE